VSVVPSQRCGEACNLDLEDKILKMTNWHRFSGRQPVESKFPAKWLSGA